MTPLVSLIYARSRNHCIGKSGGLPWHLPDEMRFFKETTFGNPIIMGRKTYEDHKRLLPGRMNIIVSRNPGYEIAAGAHLAHSLSAAVDLAAGRTPEVFVIGGVRLLIEAFPLARRVYETVVEADINGDVYLPALDLDGWQSTPLHRHEPDARHAYGYAVTRYERSLP